MKSEHHRLGDAILAVYDLYVIVLNLNEHSPAERERHRRLLFWRNNFLRAKPLPILLQPSLEPWPKPQGRSRLVRPASLPCCLGPLHRPFDPRLSMRLRKVRGSLRMPTFNN